MIDFGKFKSNLIENVNAALKVSAANIQAEAVELIRTPSNSGKTVKRGNKRHIISKRGEAPNADTGNLMGNIHIDSGHLHATVYALPNYALYLETYLERPFLSTAFKNQKSQIVKNIARASKAAFK